MLEQYIPVRETRELSIPLLRRIGAQEVAAGGVILATTLWRLVLLGLGWPLTNSDEGTVGIMALHIAYRGAHPIFFYGQHYMGSLEAFLAAGLFRLFSPSLLLLRVVPLGLFTLALIGIYVLSRLLFSRAWALVTLLLVSAGSGLAMANELRAIGGYPETLLFCALLMLCASWLALSYQPQAAKRTQIRRWLVYLLWGLVAGLGMWTDMLIAPSILASGLLLLLLCWRELWRPLTLLCLFAGLCIGAFPLIYYNLHAAPGQDSLSVIRSLQGAGNPTFHTPSALLQEVGSTVDVSLPLMTGEPFCPVTEIPFVGPTSAPTLACTLARGTWGLGYVALLFLACVLIGGRAWRLWRKRKLASNEPGFSYTLRRQFARAALLLSASLSLVLYTFSSGSFTGPGLHSRYLICLLVSTPAIFWPLQEGLLRVRMPARAREFILPILSIGVLLAFCSLSQLGSVLAINEVPAARALNQQDANLIHTLEAFHVRHIYTDYWTCDTIAFESHEQIICAVVNSQMQPSLHYNRYFPYYTQVSADPDASYVIPRNPVEFAPAAIGTKAPFNQHYHEIILNGYDIYVFR
jgi:hypothetical protein